MHRHHQTLINTACVELWPGHLASARSNADARIIALSDWLLRRKLDGRFLAAIKGSMITSLVSDLAAEPGITEAQQALIAATHDLDATGDWCRRSIDAHLVALGVAADYGEQHQLAPVAEPLRLRYAGRDRYRRPLWLQHRAARAWHQMKLSAHLDSVVLEAVSGYRSIAYQRGIFDRKFARGQTIAEILRVNAAPGYSEHHSGCAIDISSRGEPAAEESFETTEAFRWLSERAGDFGFRLSYPRNNPHGVVYEPWHWCWTSKN